MKTLTNYKMNIERKLQAIEDLRQLALKSGKLETVKIDMIIILDEIKKRTLETLEDESWITDEVQRGAEQNERFQYEHGAFQEPAEKKRVVGLEEEIEVYDVFHKEDLYDENFKTKEANTWMEYGLGQEASVS